jgi:hypothetical protein
MKPRASAQYDISSRLRWTVENPTHSKHSIHAVFVPLPTQSQLSLVAVNTPLCAPRKTPPQTPSPHPLFQSLIPGLTHLWKPRTHHPPSIHRDSPPLSTLPPTTSTTTRNISPFTLFLRSTLAGAKHSLTHARTKTLAVCAGPGLNNATPEIHSPIHSHEPPRTP